MKINYNYKTYEDRLGEHFEAYNKAFEKRATNSILNTAIDLFDNQQYVLSRKIAEELEKTATTEKDVYDAKKLIALCHYAQSKWAEADEAFSQLAENSNNSDDWFNAVIAATLNEQYEKSEMLFAKALEKYTQYGTERNIPSVQLIFHYLLALEAKDQNEAAFEKFNLLCQIYEQIKTSNEKYLRERGLDSISIFLASSHALLQKLDRQKVLEQLEDFKSKLDSNGQEEVRIYIEEILEKTN